MISKSFVIAIVLAIVVSTCIEAPCQKNTTELLKQARQLQSDGKLDEALALYRKCLSIDSTDREAQFSTGEVFLKKMDYSKAAAAFSSLLVLDPENTRANLYMGQASLKLGQTEKARTAFGRVLSAKPRSIQGLVGMGEAELQAGNSFTANDYFRKALALDPGNKELADNVARLRSANMERLKASEEDQRQRAKEPTERPQGETGPSGAAAPAVEGQGGDSGYPGSRVGERAWPYSQSPGGYNPNAGWNWRTRSKMPSRN
ncbi:MAG: tetratricopeptide repeat protein [Thermodesulfobacteriota bacterium]